MTAVSTVAARCQTPFVEATRWIRKMAVMMKWIVASCLALTACTEDVDPFADGRVTTQECRDNGGKAVGGPSSRPETCGDGSAPLAIITDSGPEGAICCPD